MNREVRGLIVKREDGSEIVNYDNPSFPSYIYDGWVAPHVTWERVPHFHEDLEIVAVKSGNMAYSVNGKTVMLSPGDTIVVNSNQIHYSMCINDEVARYVIFVVHPSIMMSSVEVEMQAVRPIIENKDLSFIRFRKNNEYSEDVFNIMLQLPEIRNDAFQVTRHLFDLWDYLLKSGSRYQMIDENTSFDPRMNLFKSMMYYISESYKDNITLAKIADSAHISKSLCNNLFNQYVGESPINYVMHFRCRKVAEYLRSSPMSLSDIAAITGFNGVSYMSEVFRKYFDSSPSEYRKKWASI
ncbi:MAG: AraC family transcriptional regulator [Eubacterium sp.]|nr:AraC family transcriptional regulator [Eubacterium sp.]